MEKEASAEAQKQLYEIDKDIASELKLGGRTFRVKNIKSNISDKISYMTAKKNLLLEMEDNKVLLKIDTNNKLPAKVLALTICGIYWKVWFVYPFLWRWIRSNCTNEEIFSGLSHVSEKLQLGFFFHNMLLIENLNNLRIQMTKKEALVLQAERQSETKQTS
jgi:hypothetical protein